MEDTKNLLSKKINASKNNLHLIVLVEFCHPDIFNKRENTVWFKWWLYKLNRKIEQRLLSNTGEHGQL